MCVCKHTDVYMVSPKIYKHTNTHKHALRTSCLAICTSPEHPCCASWKKSKNLFGADDSGLGFIFFFHQILSLWCLGAEPRAPRRSRVPPERRTFRSASAATALRRRGHEGAGEHLRRAARGGGGGRAGLPLVKGE